MKRVAISQRSDPIAGRDETRDALDVRFAPMLWDMGFLPLPVCSALENPAPYIAALAPDAIVLSGGNDIGTAPERDATEIALLDYATANRTPVFALCRGLQMLNLHQGGSLAEIKGHVACDHQISGPLYPNGRTVNSYHNLTVTTETLGRDLRVLAQADDGSVEALGHTTLPWLAVMWHPERETPPNPTDLALMKQYLETGTQS